VLACTAASLVLAGCGGSPTEPPAPESSGAQAAIAVAAAPARDDAVTHDSPAPDSSSPSTPAPVTPSRAAGQPVPVAGRVSGVVASGLVTPLVDPAVHAGTFALGDSFLLGSATTMTKAHIRVDAVVGRQFYAGIPVLRAAVRTGTLPRNLVVHLGTNGTVTSRHCDNVVATAGSHRRVFLVTVIGPRSWMAPNDRVLKACAGRHRGQVVVVDWAGISASHPGWFGPDRVHPNPTGRKRYNALVLSALARYAI
jgi:hypothetical protein